MRNIKKTSFALVSLVALWVCGGGTVAMAASGGVHLEPAGNDVNNIKSLQEGARNFMNYCSGCHSAQYVRYNTIARDLDLSDDQVADNLMFNADKMFETIVASMPADDAKRWFGQPPPDMSLIARAKGTDHVYNFLKGFYIDPDSPTGVDNLVLSGTSMPHVLWELQGYQKAVFRDEAVEGQEGVTRHVFDSFDLVEAGSMTAEEYDDFARDTANFLEYIAEPERSTRRTVGTWVLIYLIFFLIVAIMLKKQIWKDVT
jgi:ubiquinol-cytochrome c reductase cytochrome c1 subunit